MNLEEARKLIDEVDAQMLALLKRRAVLSRLIGQIKMRAGLPIIDREREDVVLGRIARENRGEIEAQALTGIYREILSESRRIQSTVGSEVSRAGELSK